MANILPSACARLLPTVLPLCTIALARFLTFSNWAAQYAGLSAALYVWIVADALLLGLIAKAPRHKPPLFQMVGKLSLASLIILFGASAPLQEIYFSMPAVLFATSGTLILFALWSSLRIVTGRRRTGSWRTGFESVFPKQLVRIAISECRILWLGLFRWGAPVDAPAGMKAYAYHTYLVPMIATFLALQLIELSVVHLLLMLWNPTVAWIMLGLSVWGVIWTMALLKSFRIKPVLLGKMTLRVRSGMIFDFAVPLDCIADDHSSFTKDELTQPHIVNLALMSAPNVSLRLSRPIAIRTLLGKTRVVSGVALRLDDSSGFIADLARRR